MAPATTVRLAVELGGDPVYRPDEGTASAADDARPQTARLMSLSLLMLGPIRLTAHALDRNTLTREHLVL